MSVRPPESGKVGEQTSPTISPVPTKGVSLTVLSGGDAPPADETGDLDPMELIQDHLDHLCAPLVGVVPYRERSRLREEAGDHLEQLANAYTLEGMAYEDAVRQAVGKYGSSSEVTQQFLEAWFSHQAQGQIARRIGLANLRALIWFGLATFLTTLLVQIRVFFPDPHPLLMGLSLAQMRRLLPEPFPLPDSSPISVMLLITTIVAPIAAGWVTGMTVPVRPARSVYQVQILLTLYTFLLGMQMLPLRDGLFLAVAQLFYWIPVGCITAHISCVLNWRRHCLRSVLNSGGGKPPRPPKLERLRTG